VIESENSRSAARHPRTVALTGLLCCALFLACIPAATARSDHTRGSREASAPAQTSEPSQPTSEPRPQRNDTGQGAAESTQTPPARAEHRSRRTSRSGSATEAAQASPEATAAPAPATRRGDGPQRRQDAGRGGRGEGRGGHGVLGEGGGQGKGAKADSKSRSTSETGSSPESRRTQERARKPAHTHVAKGKAGKIEAARPATPASEPVSTATPSVAPASTSVTTAVAASATAVVAAPLARGALGTGGAPSIAGRSPRRAGAKASRRAPLRSAPRGSTIPASPALISATPSSGLASRASSSSHPVRLAKGAAPALSSSPLVTTITRIVGVVPTPIRVLIGALVALALAMAARSRLTARRARRAEQQRRELLEDVGLLQAALLPVTPARLGPVGTSTAYRPAAGPAAGGDFYDVFALEDGKLAVIVGDVSGHGRKALPHTALLRFTLRAYLEAGLSPRDAVQMAGTVLERQLGGSFATVVAATYHPRERRLIYASAGHPPPIVLGGGSPAEPLEPVTASSSPPIGVGRPTGIRQSIVSVPGRAQICFFTDGVTEARVGGELYGAQRLGSALGELGPQATAAELLERVAQSTDARPDDMAACLLQVEGGDAPPSALEEELELDRDEASSERTERFLAACGVAPEDAAQIMRAARDAAERSGSVLLELRHGPGGSPEVSLRQHNLTYLPARHAARQADLRMSI
jgi:serine phosphatase RsbU (regulator of sigma subunit)